jgi:general secretion pathway protein G
MRRKPGGFTLIELMVVMTIVALLVAIALPRYVNSVDRSREAALKQDLAVMRDAVDKFYGDVGRYPNEIDELVARRYLRRIPEDPVTESAQTWVVLPPPVATLQGRVYDVRSGAQGKAADGSSYADW